MVEVYPPTVNVLSEEKKQQVLALGRLGWSLRRIERAVHIRRETVSTYLKAAGILVQPHRDQRAAEQFFRRLLRGQGQEPFCIITDKLRSYSAALRTILCEVGHNTERYANNRAEASHQPTRQRERQMRRFKSAGQAQQSLFRLSSRISFELDGIC